MFRKVLSLFLILLLLSANIVKISKAEAAATVPLSISVNGSLVVSDADNDTQAGKDPTKNVSLTITPDLGHTIQTGSANFRLRTNKSTWRLTAQRTATNAGGTQIADADVKVNIGKSAGSKGNASAGAIQAPFNAQTDLTSIPVISAADVISGSSKTSSVKDFSNADNWFQVSTTYSLNPDFFYEPGTFSTTITYNLVSP